MIKEGVYEEDIAFIRVKGKGDKEREIPITGKPLETLIDYLKTHDFDTVFPISYHLLWRKIRETGRKLGIDIHPHKLRHTAATMALQAGAELRVIQELLGHASPITTARYAKVGQKQLLKATKVLAEKNRPVRCMDEEIVFFANFFNTCICKRRKSLGYLKFKTV